MSVLRFGAFVLDPARGAVLRDGVEVELRTQSFAVLSYLASNPGRLVSKDALLDAIWPDRHAMPDSLVQCITEIRKALGDADHRIIKTVRGKGYRFVAEISPMPPPPPTVPEPDRNPPRNPSPPTVPRTGWPTPLIAACLILGALTGSGWLLWNFARPHSPAMLTMMAEPSIAVLPFRGESGEGPLADDIATQLRRVPRGFKILVRSATAPKHGSANPKAAALELGVRYVVIGSKRRERDTVHVTVQLIEAESARQLWARVFDYPAGEPGAQNRTAARIARLVTEQLVATESKRPLPAEPKADHYAIMGRALWAGERGTKITLEAMTLFKKGLDLDPNSVPALQGYARAKISAVLGGHAPQGQRLQWLSDAEKAIDSVIDQRRGSYGAYRLRGSLYRARGEWDKAIKAFKRALEINSDYAEAHGELGRVKIELGQAEDALKDIEKAIALSPTDPAALSGWQLWAGQAAIHLGKYEMALNRLLDAEQADHANEEVPPWLALAYAGLGQEGKARALIAEYLDKTPSFALATWNQDNPRDHPVVGPQRDRIAATMKRLGVPEGNVTAASKP